jgi:hypothetical protein
MAVSAAALGALDGGGRYATAGPTDALSLSGDELVPFAAAVHA